MGIGHVRSARLKLNLGIYPSLPSMADTCTAPHFYGTCGLCGRCFQHHGSYDRCRRDYADPAQQSF